MTATFATLLTSLAASLLVACGSDDVVAPTGLADPGLSNVRTENAAARSATVDENGGTITATGSNGVVYTLTIPANALDSTVSISMYPIASMSGYPAGGTMAAGVHLAPEGLTMAIPLTLTMELPTAPGTDHIGIASRANAAEFHGHPAVFEGRVVSFTVDHFSQYSVGDPILDSLLGGVHGGSNPSDLRQTELAIAYNRFREAGTSPSDEFRRVLRAWYQEIVRPRLDEFTIYSFTRYSVDFSLMRNAYNRWLSAITFVRRTSPTTVDIETELRDSRERAAVALQHGIDETNIEIERLAGGDPTGPSITELRDVIETGCFAIMLQELAAQWSIATASNRLDKESVLNGLKVKAVIERRTLPSNFAPGGLGNLDIVAGLSVVGRTPRHDYPLAITLSNFAPATVDPTAGTTGSDGGFRTSVQWPANQSELRIDVLASIRHPRLAPRHSISVFDRITHEVDPGITQSQWQSLTHEYRHGDGTREVAGLYLILKANGELDGTKILANGQRRWLFTVPVDRNGRRFTGTADLPLDEFKFTLRGYTVIVNGEILADGRLDFAWNAADNHSDQTVEGAEVMPRF
ncbi:MAG TPA: hypothetical protein VNA88_12010 [Candidatus Kapabacteria bacterium]|nr:hypothetical protein [Candidatus Kapabacteria bacterium]